MVHMIWTMFRLYNIAHIIYDMVYKIWSTISYAAYDMRSGRFISDKSMLKLSLAAEDMSEFSSNIHPFQRFMEPWSD